MDSAERGAIELRALPRGKSRTLDRLPDRLGDGLGRRQGHPLAPRGGEGRPVNESVSTGWEEGVKLEYRHAQLHFQRFTRAEQSGLVRP